MTPFQVLLAFWASPASVQAEALPSIPKDCGDPTFFSRFELNPLPLLMGHFEEIAQHHDYEPWEEFLDRTGLAKDFSPSDSALIELVYLLSLVKTKFFESSYSRKGLEREIEWRLVRRLAGIILDELGWTREFPAESLRLLSDSLVKEKRLEMLRMRKVL